MIHATKDFIDHYKGPLNDILTDLRDAKRRIGLVNGPARRKTNQSSLPEADDAEDDTSEAPNEED